MILLRRQLGDVLRRHRLRQSRTLREVAAAAQVSLGYLSEIERGRKEASSELLASICAALGISLADVLREVSEDLALAEARPLAPIGFAPTASATGQMRPVAGVAPLVPARALPGRRERPVTPVASLSVTPFVAA
jgi:transcriptional regulator with XRE-family HTH domain